MAKSGLTSLVVGATLFLSSPSESSCLDDLLNFRCQPYHQQCNPKKQIQKKYPPTFIADEVKKIIEESGVYKERENKVYGLWMDVYKSIKQGDILKEEKEWYNALSPIERRAFEDEISDECQHNSEFMIRFGEEMSMYHLKKRDFIFFKRIIDSAELLSEDYNPPLGLGDFKEDNQEIEKENFEKYFKITYPSVHPFLKFSFPKDKLSYELNNIKRFI